MRAAAWGVLLAAAMAPAAQAQVPALRAELVLSGLASPTYATSPPGDSRLFILERAGRIRIFEGGAPQATPFLDIEGQVSTDGERGLLGLAFPPDYATSGLFYVYYTRPDGDSVLARFSVSTDPDVADPNSEEILLVVGQPFGNHNGGTIAFSPKDGFLYWGLGDGGSRDDPDERAQDGGTLLGKMLRLNVGGGVGTPATIPPDNPFVDDPNVLDEIWALGLRNPFRFSFDRETGDLWIADVGQGKLEEVNFEPAADPGGRNYGWDVMEGTLCNNRDPAPSPPCNDPSLTLPVHEYDHDEGCSITGGAVYRGSIPGLAGRYFFADFCQARIWSFDRTEGTLIEHTGELPPAPDGTPIDMVVAIAEDAAGELYIVDLGGEIFRLESAEVDGDGDGVPDSLDSDPDDATRCRDADGEGCDDCSSGVDDPSNDGPDTDRDGICDPGDNCMIVGNADQADADADGIGNACECGDFDGDGLVNTTDARLIQRCSVGAIPCQGLCDASGDGVCNTTDARLIQRLAVGQLTKENLTCAERL